MGVEADMRSTCIGTASRIFSLTRRAWRATDGGAAIEFGFLAPLLMLMLLGTIEGGRAVNIDRHFTSAVATAGDLVAREEFLGTSSSGAKGNLDSMMGSIAHMMAPYNADDLSIGIFSVQASPTNASDTKVVWSYSYKGKMSVPSKCQSYALPANLVPKGGSVIVVDAKYKFTPLFGDYVPGFGSLGEFKEKGYHSPRNSCVDYVKNDNCTNSC
jgi:Flp pilus assembly protein TadG